ncbi:MAG: hypothetical protein IPK78_03865 [Rhodospirillales bacterium]|nr:hypothetical protein [Rhodospirillales bacterium]
MMASYERILRVVVLLDALLGVVLLLSPSVLAGDAGPTAANIWPRAAGFLLLLLSLALLPPAIFAPANRYLAVLAAVAQAMIGLFFVVSGTPFAWLLAIAFFASSYLLAAALWRGFQQYLMSKP